MKIKKFIFIVFSFIIFFTIGNNNVIASNNSNGQSNGGTVNAGDDCYSSNNYIICSNGGTYLNLRMTLVYAEYNKKREQWRYKQYGDTVYIIRNDTKKPNCDGNGIKCIYKSEWFKTNNGTYVDIDRLATDTLGGRRNVSHEVAWKNLKQILKPWFGVTKDELLKDHSYSCSTDNANGKCYRDSGWRIFYEPFVWGHYPGTYNDSHWTIKEANMLAGSSTANNKAWKHYRTTLYTEFNDVGIKKYSAGACANMSHSNMSKNYKAFLKNKWVGDKKDGAMTGCGFHIQDVSAAIIDPYKCELSNTDPGKCNIVEGDDIKEKGIECTNKNGKPKTKHVDKKKNKTYTFEACPIPKFECEETSEYGKCKIYQTNENKRKPVETVLCNKDNRHEGKDTYAGYKLSKKCPFKPKYNYDIDVACTNCDDKNTMDNKSYYIQDTNDWRSIIHSLKRNDNTTLQTYFVAPNERESFESPLLNENKYEYQATEKRDGTFASYTGDDIPSLGNNQILCRNEYGISFPEQSSVLVVPGRYFTVNKQGIAYMNGVYNFKPIKVTRIRECISNNPGTLDIYNNGHQLNSFGTIKLNYNEKYYESGKQTLLKNLNRIDRNYKHDTVSVNGTIYARRTDEATVYYELHPNIYRYVALGQITIDGKTYEAGESALNKPTNIEHFKDLGTANLPSSVNNTDGAKLTLDYILPADSKIRNLRNYNSLETAPTEAPQFDLNKSSCAKMYGGINNSGYNSCINKNNNKNSCFKSFKTEDGANTNNYICNIKSTGGNECVAGDSNCNGGPGCEPTTCYELSPSNDKEVTTTSSDRKYICSDGNICSQSEYIESCGIRKCVYEDGKYYGQNGEEITGGNREAIYYNQCGKTVESCKATCKAGYCCPGTGNVCPTKNPDGGWVCPLTNNCDECDLDKMEEKYGGKDENNRTVSCRDAGYCCPDTEMGCPACYLDKNGNCEWKCPSGGGKIIYRTIDLNNPFPGQKGIGRVTGKNWCSKNISTTEEITISCDNQNSQKATDSTATTNINGKSGNNSVVISKIKNNRKVLTNEVYSKKEPMYEFHLTATDIRSIREYNNDHVYDNADSLLYNSGLGTYSSSFFRDRNKVITMTNNSTCYDIADLKRNENGVVLCQESGS